MSSTQESSQNNESTINNPPGSAVKRLRVSNGFASGSSATSACEFDNAVYSPVRQVDQANIAVHDKIEADDKVRGQTFADQYHNLVKPHLQLPHKPPSLPLQVVNEQSFPDVRARCAALERLVQQAAQRIAALEQQERQSIKELGARWNVYHHQELYKTQAQLTTALQKEIDLRVMVWQDAQNRERQLVQSSKSQHEALQARIDKQHEFIGIHPIYN